MKRYWWILAGVLLYAITKGAQEVFAVKPGVQLAHTWQVQMLRNAVGSVWQAYGYQPTITSSMDGSHMQQSKHYEGLAEDYRTKDLPADMKRQMIAEVRNILGPDFDVLFEDEGKANEHLHIEYDPK